MANTDTVFRIVVDSSGAVKAIKDLSTAQKDLNTSVTQASSGLSKFQSSIISLDSASNLLQRGFTGLEAITRGVFNSLAEAQTIEGLTASFDNLQKSINQNASQTLPSLQTATKGLISDTDLMRQANQAVLLGVDKGTGGFDKMAAAAVKLGQATGRTATEALGDLITGVGRASPLILDNLGITVKAEDAYLKYASSIKKTASELTDAEKKIAFQQAAFEAITEKASKLTDVQDTAGISAQKLTTQFENLRSKVLLGISSNTDLRDAINNVAESLANTDPQPLIDGLVNIAKFGIDTINVVTKLTGALSELLSLYSPFGQFQQSVKSFAFDTGSALREVAGFESKLQPFEDSMNRIVGLMEKDTKEATAEAVKGFNKLVQEVNNAHPVIGQKLAKDITTITEGLTEQAKRLGVVKTTTQEIVPKVEQHTGAITRTTKALSDENKESKKKEDSLLKTADKLEKLITSSEKYKDILKKVSDGSFTAEKAQKELGDLYNEVKGKNEEAEKATKILNDELVRMQTAGGQAGQGLGEVILNAGLAQEKLEELRKSAESGKGMLGSIFGVDLDKLGSDLKGNELFSTIADGLGDALVKGVEDGFNRDSLKAVFSQGGEALGRYFGIPFAGSIFGKFLEPIADIGKNSSSTLKGITRGIDAMFPGIGSAIQAGLGGMFGDSASTTARKQVDKFFADILKPANLSLVINGQLKKVSDLVFSGNQKGGLFASLPEATQSAFSTVGQAFEGLLGIGTDVSTSLGNVFANNLGGSLNNLQILIATSGQSFETLKESVIDSFNTQKLSFLEAETALQGIRKVAEKGIPDGIGLTIEAFQNLENAGVKGGAVSVDALKDLGSEAKELGLKTIPDLANNLQKSGRLNADSIKLLFDALSKYGVRSLEELENVSDETAIGILANLQANKFSFNEQAKSIKELNEELAKIPEKVERTLKFNVQVNATKEDRALIANSGIDFFKGKSVSQG